MEKVVQKALEIKPEHRFQSAGEMRKVLLGEISFDELSTKGFIIINPKEVQFLNLKPGHEKAAEITVRSSRENYKIHGRVTSEHPGLLVEPSAIDEESAAISVRPEFKKFKRGEKTTASIILSTESSKITIPVTVHYEPTLLGRIPRAWYFLLGFIIPIVVLSFYIEKIVDLAKSCPVDLFFFILFYVIITGCIAFLPTIRKREMKPLALAGNILLILLPFVFVYLYCYRLPFQALRNTYTLTQRSGKNIRSICHRVLLWGLEAIALYHLAREGDHSSLPYIIWAMSITNIETNSGINHDYIHGDDHDCSSAISWISNQKAGDTSKEMWEWYWRNRNKSDIELWTEGFRAQGYEVSLNEGRESIDTLLALLGQKRGLWRDWLLYNACRMLDHFKSDEVAERVNWAIKSGSDDEKAGVNLYCSYLYYRLVLLSLRRDNDRFNALIHRTERIPLMDEYISGKKLALSRTVQYPEIPLCQDRTLLHYAIHRDIADILIRRGVDVNAADLGGLTPLHCGAIEGNAEMARFLLEKGAIVDARDTSGNTPLHYARSVDIAKMLIDHGADINGKNRYGGTPLNCAILDINIHLQELRNPAFCDAGLSSAKIKAIRKTIDFLLSKGADVKAGNNKGMTPLHVTESYEIAQLLIDHGADVNIRNNEEMTPLHEVASLIVGDPLRVAQLLIANGADVNAKDAGERTPLSWALFCQHYYKAEYNSLIIELLKNKGGHENVYAFFNALEKKNTTRICELLKENPKLVNCCDPDENTPLAKAIEDNNCRMVEFLLDRGAKVKKVRGWETPLAVAVSNNSVATAKLLISREKCIQEYGELLMISLELGYNNITSLLLQSGADVNFRNSAGQTPLHTAASRERCDAVPILISKGAKIDVPDKEGQTPLHKAADSGNLDAVKLLVSHGGDINTKDRIGRTPLYNAVTNDSCSTAGFLLAQGADLKIDFKDGKPHLYTTTLEGDQQMTSLLHIAALNGNLQMTSLLLSKGASVDAVDSNGWTPLHHASFKGHRDIVKLLLDHRANPNASNSAGETPLLCALEENHQEAAALLRAAGAKEL